MTSNDAPQDSHPSISLVTDCTVEQTLTEVEQALTELGDRYTQVRDDWQKYTRLQQHQEELEGKKIFNPEKDPIKTELNHIIRELEALEIGLESALLPDLFWQAVRFGGLGIVIGWLLKSLAG